MAGRVTWPDMTTTPMTSSVRPARNANCGSSIPNGRAMFRNGFSSSSALAQGNPQERERPGRSVLVARRRLHAADAVERERPAAEDEEEDRDAQDVDVLEDALEGERLHREHAEQREQDRPRARGEAEQQHEPAHGLDDQDRVADQVVVRPQVRREEDAEERRDGEGHPEVQPEHRGSHPGEPLEGLQELRLGDAMLDQIRQTDGAEGDDEGDDHRQRQQQGPVGRMCRRIGEPLHVRRYACVHCALLNDNRETGIRPRPSSVPWA